MNYRDYFNNLEKTANYNETELKFKVILDLADEVLRLRMENGWSQSELAERVGTKQANISRLESGLSNPSVNFLQKVSNAFGVNLSIHFEKIPVEGIYISSDSDNKSLEAYPVANWPTSSFYQSFEHSSQSEEIS